MIRINLLPHRQLKRAARQRHFNLMLAVAAIAGVVIVFAGETIISAKISAQVERNARLDAANAKLDKQIDEIKDLKNQIQNVLDRKKVVENLQSNRSQAVVVLDEISRRLPEGVVLKSIKQQANVINLEGLADTNARVATLVRNFSDSRWLESPNLIEIRSTTVNNLKQNAFTMNVKLKAPQQEAQDSNPKTMGKKS